MKTLATLAILSSLAALTPAQLQIVGRGKGPFLPVDKPETYDGLLLGTALGPPVGRTVSGDPNFAVQRFRVEDSRAFAPGSVVEVYFRTLSGGIADQYVQNGVPFTPPNAVPTGARVLLLASATRGDQLRVPDLSLFDPRQAKAFPIGENAPPSAFAWTWFPTTRGQLAPVADPKWRMLESLAAAIPGTPDANARAITEEIQYLSFRDDDRAFGTAEDRFSKTFAAAVAKDTPYHRALVDFALNRLAYWGYGDRFYKDMRASADDPNAFPDGIPPLQFWEQVGNGNNNELPKDFRHDSGTTWEEHRAILNHAKSPSIAEWLLDKMPKPDDADVKALAARFLDAPDPRPRRAMVERLAAWNGLPAPEPVKETLDGAGVRHYEAPPGLDAAVAFWKRKLALP